MNRTMIIQLVVGAILAAAGPAHSAGFEILHEFAGGGDDGRHPRGSLTLDGSTLYGMTQHGGDSNYGTILPYEPGK